MSVLDRVPVDRIAERAAQINLARALLTLLVVVPWLVGWSGRMAYRGLVFGAAAVAVGWEAGGPKPQQRR